MAKPVDLSLDLDPHRDLRSGAQQYTNCLAFAAKKKVLQRKYTDACSAHFCGFRGVVDFAGIMTAVFNKLRPTNFRWRVIGTSPQTPTQNAPSIARRQLIGVGQEPGDGGDGDLHFYVVTQTNGDGQGLCGVIDAQGNKVMPCRLRGTRVLQFSGVGGPPHEYRLLGFIEIE